MTPLLKELEQRETGKNQSRLGNLFIFAALEEAVTDFWRQTFRPAGHLLSQTISVFWQQVLVPAVRQGSTNMRERMERLSWTAKRRPKAPTMQVKVALETGMCKIHGALGERWASEGEERPIRVNMGKQNPWIAAEKKVLILKSPEQSPRQQPRQALHIQAESQSRRQSKAPTVFSVDEIRGLDDIFVGPVQTSFMDVLRRPKKSDKTLSTPPGQAISGPSVTMPKAGSVPPTVPVTFPVDTTAPETDPLALQTSVKMQALARKQAALREESQKLKSRVKHIAESTQDWFVRTDASASTEVSPSPPLAEVASFASYVSKDVGETVSGLIPSLSLPGKDASSVRVAQPASRPENGLLRRAKAKPPELTYELAADLSGFDYMIQSNRILSKSISNLVDGYFHQASLEEEPNYY